MAAPAPRMVHTVRRGTFLFRVVVVRTLFRLILSFVFVGLAVTAALVWLALADEPLVTSTRPFTHQDIARAKELLRANDPRRLPAESHGTVVLNPTDLDLISDYLIRRIGAADARVRLSEDRLTLELTREWKRLPGRRYLNIALMLETAEGTPQLAALRIGDVAIPLPLARSALGTVWRALAADRDTAGLADLVDRVRVSPQSLRIRYRWDPQLIDEAGETLLSETDRTSLRRYHDLIVQLQRQGVGREGSLTTLLTPLFAAALARSRDRDAVEENRALLTVLGAWSVHRGLKRLVPGDVPRPARFRLRLRGRTDFAQHFLVSAALSAQGDSFLSNAVGLFKEIADVEQGSGFSFTDIAADVAGSRFGEIAVASPTSASKLQHRAAVGLNEPDIMPEVRDLPEFMDRAAFTQRFERVGSPAYRAMMSRIEARVEGLPLYRAD